MDSLLDPSAFGELDVGAPDGWTRLLRRAWQPSIRPRARLLELDPWRCAALALGLCALATLGGVACLWNERAQAVVTSAAAAIEFLDARLDEIGAQAQGLAADVATAASAEPCPREVTLRLLRSSLDGLLVRRWWLQGEFRTMACGPEGLTVAPELAQAPDRRLTLMTRHSTGAELLAVQRTGGSQSIVALLDPRALALPSQGPWQTDGATGERITLHAGDGRTLQVWSRGPVAGPGEAWLQARQSSARHGMAVSVDIDRAGVMADLRRQLPGLLTAALLCSGTIAAWAWRQAVRRARLVHRLEHALHKRQFEPWVQPIVDLSSGRCVGGEILMRWVHPQRGIVPPGEFIEVAEQTGLIGSMSQLVMTRAAHRLAPLARRHRQLYFSFNLTPDQLRAPLITQTLGELFNPETLPREQVLLELTEREIVDPAAHGALTALNLAGWRIAIDDFGTGHSSLALLERLPIQRLKIDRAFVASIGGRSATRPVLDAIIGLARDLDIRLIAEGVETQDQWDYLAARGVGSAQGYLIARPMPLPAFEQWLAGHPPATAAGGAPDVAQRLPEHELQALWQRMRSTGGLDIRDRMYHLRGY
ncbi:MAG: EAL domain-containing protein, partial [Caldimonas sp.]